MNLVIWEFLNNKKIEDLLSYKFYSTKNGTYEHNGDFYTHIFINGYLCTYIIDYDAEYSSKITNKPLYDYKHYIEKYKSTSEVIIFNDKLLYGDVYKIIAFNSREISFNLFNKNDNFHCKEHGAKLSYEPNIHDDNWTLKENEFYIDGKKIDKNLFNRIKKIKKIKQINKL